MACALAVTSNASLSEGAHAWLGLGAAAYACAADWDKGNLKQVIFINMKEASSGQALTLMRCVQTVSSPVETSSIRTASIDAPAPAQGAAGRHLLQVT